MASSSSSVISMRLLLDEESFSAKKGDLVRRALCAVRRVWDSALPTRSSTIGDLR